MTAELDLLVLGSGVAGLSAAVRAAGPMGLRVGLLTKGALDQATTRWAQGGVAAVLDEDPDSLDLHISDTLEAGADLCDAAAVRVLVDEGPRRDPRAGDLPTAHRRPFRHPPPPGQHRPRGPGLSRQGSRQGRA